MALQVVLLLEDFCVSRLFFIFYILIFWGQNAYWMAWQFFERSIFIFYLFFCSLYYSGDSGEISHRCQALEELQLTSYCLFYGPFMKLVCVCVCWTRVGQWVSVAGCGSELWAFACFLCVSWWGRGVNPATPWGRRRIGQTRWTSHCTSRKKITIRCSQ